MKKIIIPVMLCSFLVMSLFVTQSYANDDTPGSSSDPIVTKSYVDEQIASILNSFGDYSNTNNSNNSNSDNYLSNEQIEMLTNQIKSEILIQVEADVMNKLSDVQNTSPLHQPVQAFAGQTIIGGQGTEIILRSGEAVVYSSVENGVTNLTTGINLNNGDDITWDNLLIVPRNDGRGVTVTTDHAWFMIRGDYEIIG